MDDEMEIRKSSTMNSQYINSTISKPNVESIINAVATILHSQMLEVSINTTNLNWLGKLRFIKLHNLSLGLKPKQED